jgi:hypothetical protein
MNLIITTENKRVENYKKNYKILFEIEKYFIEKNFDWIKIEINGKLLMGKGNLKTGKKTFPVEIHYSPFFFDSFGRFDLIRIKDVTLKYNKDIHVYRNLSLCLYHPIIDKEPSETIPLVRMIPWITEWCVHYEEWKKYKVWLGREIKH